MLSYKDIFLGNNIVNITKQYESYLDDLHKVLTNLDRKKLDKLFLAISKRVGSKQTVFICGNGGSAATASHMVCDLSKTSLGGEDRKSEINLRVISLNDNVSALTAWANDTDYKYIFSEQLKNLGNKGDLLIVISASGNSQNVLEAISAAKKLGIETFGLLGFDGGKVKDQIDEFIIAESFDYGVVEDTHSILNHFLTNCIKRFIQNKRY